jgi:hypothetical protein
MRPIRDAVVVVARVLIAALSGAILLAGPAAAQARGGGPVCVYEHAGFNGRQLCFHAGQSVPRIRDHGDFWNDRVSSISIAPGFSVRVCQHDGFAGRCATYDRSITNLAHQGFNDEISSLSVNRPHAGGPPPPGGPGFGRDDLREQMYGFRDACERGDRRACVRLGIIIGEHRERRAQWQRESPDLFWWDR